MRIKQDNLPLSHLAKEQILKLIESGEYMVNDKLPTESQIQEMLGVSRGTVREALALLEEGGIVRKIQGKGTFLAKKPIKIEDGLEELKSVTDILKSYGYSPGTKGFNIKKIKPDKEMQQKLKLEKGEAVLTFERIRTVNGNVAAYCLDSFPAKYFKEKLPDLNFSGSMFEYLEKELDIIIDYAVAEIAPAFFTGEMCKKLGLTEDTPFLLLKQIHYCNKGDPIIYSLDYFNVNIFKFIVNRKRTKI
ncbi:MAG: GntR family transcriptional regulator [Bacillota bacterium]